jgi:hypothetical protein
MNILYNHTELLKPMDTIDLGLASNEQQFPISPQQLSRTLRPVTFHSYSISRTIDGIFLPIPASRIEKNDGSISKL